MTAISPTATAYGFAAYLASFELNDATSAVTSRASTRVEEPITRTFRSASPWRFPASGAQGTIVTTSASDAAPIFIAPDRPEDELLAQLVELGRLKEGWDGEHAAPPSRPALDDATSFARVAGSLVSQVEPTLHVDGSVLLEIEDGARGALRFMGDGKIVYAVKGFDPGTIDFNGVDLPDRIRLALAE